MQSSRGIIRYVPSGMRLTPLEDISEDLSSDLFNHRGAKNTTKVKKSTKKVDESNLSICEENTIGASKQEFTNKWISENSFETARGSDEVVDTTVNTISPPKTICKNKSITVEDFEIVGNTKSVFDVNVEDIKLPTAAVSPNSSIESTVSDPSLQSETPQTVNVELNFKSKILQKINKSKKSKNKDNTRVQSDVATNWWQNNTTFNEVNGGSKVNKGTPLLKTDTNKPVEMTKIINNEIIVHGVVIPKPVNSVQEAYFDENIIKALESMDCTSARTMQSYMWPAILRGLNVLMIGPPQCGKTMSYVPAICTFAMDIPQKYADFSAYPGPIVLIICTDEIKCKEIYCAINNLMKECWATARVEMLTNMSSVEDCDIVVALQSDLEKCLKSQRITLKRLCHLVLEDAKRLLTNCSFMENFLKILNEMQENRPHHKSIQVIATSEKWTADLQVLMRKLYVTPVVCFHDFLEAALYSDVSFKKKKLSLGHKKFHLEDILKQKYSINKSIVFCNEDEISEVSEYLTMEGIECISISNNLLGDEILENEDMWCSLTPGRFKVLLCTDELFKKTERIVSANWLIHYSPPLDWTTFQRRFKSLGANITCFLDSDCDESLASNCSYIFIVADRTGGSAIFNDFFNELITSKIQLLKL